MGAGAEDSRAGTAPTPRVLQTQWDFSTWRSGSRPHPHPQSLRPTRAPTVGLQVQARASVQRRPGLHAGHRFFH